MPLRFLLYYNKLINEMIDAKKMYGLQKEGRTEATFSLAKNTLAMNLSIEQIIQVTGLTEEEIIKITR